MALLIFLVFLASAATSWGAEHDPLHESKIIGGNTIHVDDARFMVQVITVLKTDPKTNLSEVTVCGGTLVSTTHVLTAGHCVPSPKDVGKLRIVVGSSDLYGRGKNGRGVRAKALRAHPKYKIIREGKDEWANYDVAVIRLREAILPSAKTSLITVTKPRAEPKTGARINVAGWGVYRIKNPDESSRKLRLGTFKVIARAQCKKDFPREFTDQQFCITSNPTSAFCNGDSGGPAFIGSVQYGVVSWGSCGQERPSDSSLADLANPEINSFVNNMIRKL